MILQPLKDTREHLYFIYKIEQGAINRWGEDWAFVAPERAIRLTYEIKVIAGMNFESYFLILAHIMEWTRDQKIVYGPGRGSVGGSEVAYVMGIHELDAIEWELSFERFLNPSRVAYPDVDIDISQRHRDRVLQFIRTEFEDENTAVLQVAAFRHAGARSTIDMVFAAKSQTDPQAGAIAEQLKKLIPDGNITAGTKQEKDLTWWLENGKHNKSQQAFLELATNAGWIDTLLQLDGIHTNLAKHAAGVVIISRDDLKRLPQTSGDGINMMTGFDMYSLDDLRYLKIDILGLRTLDIISDAHKFCGGDGTTPELMKLWALKRDNNPETYDLLQNADTTGVFQVETSGYRRTLKQFKPKIFEHIVQLGALYRPGALDSIRESDGLNVVEIFIRRLHDQEPITYPSELRDKLEPILRSTQGVNLYQEQSMKIARVLAGFTETEADNLRKAIGKKQLDRMAAIKDDFINGMTKNGYSLHSAETQWHEIEASARYAWNYSHSCFYSIITFWCAYFKANTHIYEPELGLNGPGKAAFYTALINSLDEKKEKQADAIAEARQHVSIRPPDINVALESYTIDDGAIVFGLNGIKGMGEANRSAIIVERWLSGPFDSFKSFHERLPSVPINMKLSLIRCGAFNSLEGRERLLAVIPKGVDKDGNPRYWTVAEFIKHNTSLKKPRKLPSITEWRFPSEEQLAAGEVSTIGFYISADPMADVTHTLKRLDPSSHWGGEVVTGTIKTFNDRNGNQMARFTLLTNALNKQRCQIFASNWPQCKQLVVAGQRIIIRGHIDGSQLLVDAIFRPGHYEHFKVIKLKRNGQTKIEPYNGSLETVELAEASGYTVQLI